jgi:hypothetical protein
MGWVGVSDGGTTVTTSLADLPPGPELAVRLAQLSIADASDSDLVDMIAADERQKCGVDGHQLNALMELVRRRAVGTGAGEVVVGEFCADEVSCALRWSRSMAEGRLELAAGLSQRLPNVLDALSKGRIDLYKARTIAEVTEHLDRDDAVRVADAVLKRASGQTGQQVRDAARRRAYRVKPKESEKAARRKAAGVRDVRWFQRGMGTGMCWAPCRPVMRSRCGR